MVDAAEELAARIEAEALRRYPHQMALSAGRGDVDPVVPGAGGSRASRRTCSETMRPQAISRGNKAGTETARRRPATTAWLDIAWQGTTPTGMRPPRRRPAEPRPEFPCREPLMRAPPKSRVTCPAGRPVRADEGLVAAAEAGPCRRSGPRGLFRSPEGLWPHDPHAAVVGSIIFLTSVILVAGKPLISACLRMTASSLAR
jgi:hypothetical protein